MNKNITIINTEVEEVVKPNTKYKTLTVVYKDHSREGKVDSKKLLSFSADKVVWDTLEKSKSGDHFNVEVEKDNKGYFQWIAIHRQTEVPVETKAHPTPTKPTYETPQERAQRQVYIVRQSSIASAVELIKDHGKQPDPMKVIEIAKLFEDYVLGNGIAGLTNDSLPE
jgi:hypothetical protein